MRAISLYESNALDQLGLRLYDEVEILPSLGRKKLISLNRTQYNLLCDNGEKVVHEGTEISLPKLSRKISKFSLIFCCKSQNSEEGCYLLKSLSNDSFRLNGNYVHEAYINRGDEVLIGYNQLKFREKRAQMLYQLEQRDESYLNNRYVQSSLNILIEGETGTGKSRLAKMIHEKSGRVGSFVHINLSSFSHGLIESELFGHVKGAFTGACTDKDGAILEANGGTLFLDEVDSLPLDIQTKLLLFLDNKSVRPVGGQFNRTADVRLIFATGSSLVERVKRSEMRKDFYYRLVSGAKIKLPSITEDNSIIQEYCEFFAVKNNIFISPKLISFYSKLNWPGNLRQLNGHLEKKLVLSIGKKFEYDEHDGELKFGQSDVHYDVLCDAGIYSIDKLKSRYCARVYFQTGENINRSAKILGITPNTMRTLLRK